MGQPYQLTDTHTPMDLLALRSARGSSSTDRAYFAILELIANGELNETNLLSHRLLAQRLGMSKQPVAMALDRLEQEGIVESAPRVGTRLKPADADHIWNMIQFRMALECQTARLASEWLTPEDAPRLLAAAEKVDEAFGRSDQAAGYRYDADFHLLVAELSRCRLLQKELERLGVYQFMIRSCEIVNAAHVPPPSPPNDHRMVAQAILTGDPDQAERAMRNNLERSRIFGFLQWYRTSRRAAPAAEPGDDPGTAR
ncbi:MAG: GntR family transcriptional regulator [Gemmataceae bacterium]|nr:GntR family transcriptional regulator [Gemmataceae bacterium]